MLNQDLKTRGKIQDERLLLSVAMTAALLCFAMPAHAQVVPAGYEPTHALWAGADYSNFSASFPYQSGQRIVGVGAFLDYRLNYRIELEGDVRFLRFGGFESSTETNYLAGPKAYFFTKGKLRLYGKFAVGLGQIDYPFAIGNGNYFALAPSGGVNYQIKRRWKLRVDYEYQMWLNSPGFANEPNHELMPNGLNVGVAYRVFR